MCKRKTTKKLVKETFPRIISIGYCDLQNLLHYEYPTLKINTMALPCLAVVFWERLLNFGQQSKKRMGIINTQKYITWLPIWQSCKY